MMQLRTVGHIGQAFEIQMGATTLRQALPSERLDSVGPFLLLHHFGPYELGDGYDPLDVAPHPHRGFEPVTFLYQGELQHRDSRDNSGLLQAGDVQWMTSGRGIIHSEQASKRLKETGGILEGIQLWVNLAARYKMVQARYQHIKKEDLPTISLDGNSKLRLIAGAFQEQKGPVETYSPINAWQLELKAGSQVLLALPASHHACIYLLDGHLRLASSFDYQGPLLLSFRQDGEGIQLEGIAPNTRILVLSGEALGEPVVSHGPFVMNTQTEILEAMRDYKMGKMGFYI